MAAPEVAALAREMSGGAVIVNVDTEAHSDLSARFNIRAFRTSSFYGTVLQRAGVTPRSEMRRWLESN
jgi:thioredoxin 2